MSTADPFEELLLPNKNDCLASLNKTDTVSKAGTRFFLYSLFYSFQHALFSVPCLSKWCSLCATRIALRWPKIKLPFVICKSFGSIVRRAPIFQTPQKNTIFISKWMRLLFKCKKKRYLRDKAAGGKGCQRDENMFALHWILSALHAASPTFRFSIFIRRRTPRTRMRSIFLIN